MAIRYSFWSYLGKVFLCILGLAIILGSVLLVFYGVLEHSLYIGIGLTVFQLGLFLLAFNIYYIKRMANGGRKRCYNCNKWFADEFMGREVHGRELTTITRTRDVKDKNGNIVGSMDVDEAATYEYGTNYWQCNYCGYQREEKFSQIY